MAPKPPHPNAHAGCVATGRALRRQHQRAEHQQLHVSWTAETGKTYRLEREAAFLFSYRVWQTVSNDLSSGSFTESDLPCGLYYLFQVRAKVTGSAYGDGTKKLGHSQSCPSTTSAGSRNTRDHVDPPKLRVVTDNPTEDKIQIRLLLFGPTGNEEQYTPIPASLGLTDFQVDRSKRVVGSNPKEWPDSGTDLNTNYRKTRQVAEFDWTGLECGASYHFRARSGKRTVSSIQSTVVWGHWSDDASATPMIVSLSMSVHGSTRECSNLATPNVTVIPLPQRKALFQWQEVTGAGGYQVQIQKTGQDWDRTTTPLPKKMNLASDERYIEIDLNDIYEGEGLAHDTNGFEFRVMATHSDTNRNSAFSADIIVRDSPSVTVNGHSSNRNTAVVKWNAPRNAEEYFVRWRVLGDDASGNAHTSTSPVWQLDRISLPASTFAPGAATPSPTSLALTGPTTIEHTITGLTPGALHAVQVAYRIGDGWVYSGRDAYVWTSKNKPAPLTKVAGYPFYGHFTSKTYLYRICKDTFFPNDAAKQRMWVTLIENALEEWQTATNRYIMMTPDLQTGTTEYKPCTQYSSPMQVLFHSFNDRERSEIRMIDPPDSPIPVLNWSLYVYEIAADLYKHCLHKAIACVTSPGYSFYPRDATTPLPSSDISFNKDEILAYSSTRIMRDELLPNVPSGVTFGSCLNGATPRPDDNGKATRSGSQIRVTYGTYAAYATTVHEAGHALGLSDWTLSLDEDDRYVASHPVTVDSVMNYDFEAGVDEPDCAPHPLDIMAIFSLYQSP